MRVIWRGVVIIVLTTFFLYPTAAALQHGGNPNLWPSGVIHPASWFRLFAMGDFGEVLSQYLDIASGASNAFPRGGWAFAIGLPLIPLIFYVVAGTRPKKPERHYTTIFGNARFMKPSEIARLNSGLELGIDPDTGRPVKINVEGTLLSIAPPRTGKTSGLVVPNLAYPDLTSFGGPAIVIDPKGEVYAAISERRRKLGRRVIRFDPLGEGADKETWNPLESADPKKVLTLQHAARSILSQTNPNDPKDDYFRSRAASLITGALLVALQGNRRSMVEVQRLINDQDKLIAGLRDLTKRRYEPAAKDALGILTKNYRTSDPIVSTAQCAFEWMGDERMRDAVETSTFQMTEVAAGDADLFISLSSDYADILSPLTRWMLSDLMMAIRKRPRRKRRRIVLFLDEAANVGRFDAIKTAATELPGLGLSLWTFWQKLHQIRELYGENGAATLIGTAEVVTFSDIAAAEPSEAEYWSNALGNYTGIVRTFQSGGASQRPQETFLPKL